MQKRILILIAIGIAVPSFVWVGLGSSLASQSNGVNILSVTELSKNTYRVMFDFCRIDKNLDSLGVSMHSDMEFIPVPIGDNIDLNQCREYGALIHSTDISSLSTALFSRGDLLSLVEVLEKQMIDNQDLVVKTEQELLKVQEINPEDTARINQIKVTLSIFQEILDSTKESITSVRGLE